VRSHDLIRLLDEPGPERWAAPLEISFVEFTPEALIPDGREHEAPACRCAVGKYRANAAVFARWSLNFGRPRRSAWGN
jgi:hypothetical protein